VSQLPQPAVQPETRLHTLIGSPHRSTHGAQVVVVVVGSGVVVGPGVVVVVGTGVQIVE
jgi:hypothetical protein